MVDFEKIEVEVQKIANHFGPDKIILFGSFAWGTPHEDSDLDVVIIQDSEKPRIQRMREIRSQIKTNKPVDVIPLTQKEAALFRSKYSFYKQIFEEGKLVYGRV